MLVRQEALRSSARAWTAPILWRFDAALSTATAPAKFRTISPHYPFAISIMQNEIAPRFRHCGFFQLQGSYFNFQLSTFSFSQPNLRTILRH